MADPLPKTEVEFAIKRIERGELHAILIRYRLADDKPLHDAIQAYAVACARCAVAIRDAVQERRKQDP